MESHETEILRTENISKSFGGVTALSQVSFTVMAGEKLAVLGPNGAGKTTLINVINGLLPETEGEIYFLGDRVTKLSTHQRAGLGMSRSFQVDTLFNRLSVLDNVLMSIHGHHRTCSNVFKSFTSYGHYHETAQVALERIGLWEKQDYLVGLLSHGEKKKLEIVTSIVSEPRLLLLDEPNAGLTSEETMDVVQVIREMDSSTAVIIVAHDMEMVFSIADQIMVLNYGELISKDDPKTIMSDPKVKECYLGA